MIRINGELKTFAEGTVTDLVQGLGYQAEQRGIAVAVNDSVIQRSQWAIHPLRDGDCVEVVVAAQGG
jgi:sulfur carrier protein